MKTVRKLTAILLCLALALALAACGSFEQKMLKAASKMEKLKSYHMDIDMNMSLTLSMMGQSMDMDMLFKMTSDVRNDPLQLRSSMTVEMPLMGETTEILTYVFTGEEEGTYDVYASSDGGESWNGQTLNADELKQELSFDAKDLWSVDFLREGAKTFAEAGKEEINGSQATRYDGVIEAENVGAALEESGIFDSLGEAFPVDMSDIIDEFSGSIPVSLWLDDKSGMLVRYDMDMTEVLASVWDTMIAEILSELGGELGDLAELGVTIELNIFDMSATLSEFNEVGEIILPENAKAA